MGNDPNICEMHSLSTSPNLCHHLTVLNAENPLKSCARRHPLSVKKLVAVRSAYCSWLFN